MNSACSIQQFKRVSVIGKGTYAKVSLVQYQKDNKFYALKQLKKKYILEKNQQKHIMTEKQILSGFQHPFLVKLVRSFQDQKKLYFVLEYCPGGELFSLLAAKDKLTQDQAKFYAAQIVLAIEELHKHKIIYRDLKPQNIIIDEQGYIKLTDFGLSKVIEDDQTAKSICGTPQYLAPEIVKKLGHSFEVDWWCLGCLIHEMVTGYPPFRDENRKDLFQSIVFKNIDVSPFNSSLQNLLKQLLQKDPKKRLGHNSYKQVKQHPWFSKISWQTLMNKKIKAPFVPKISSDTDTRNFDNQFTSCSLNSKGDKDELTKAMNQKFEGFSFQ